MSTDNDDSGEKGKDFKFSTAETKEATASADELLQFAQFEIDRVTDLHNVAIKENSPAGMKTWKKMLDQARTRIDLLKTEVQLSKGDLETLRKNVSDVYHNVNLADYSAEDFDVVQAEIKAFEELENFLQQNEEGKFRKRKDFEKWKQERAAQAKEVVVSHHAEADKAKETEAREKILMAAIAQQGGTGVSTSFPYGFAPDGNAGFNDIIQQKRGIRRYGRNDHPRNFAMDSLAGAFRQPRDTARSDQSYYMKQADVNEAVILAPHVIVEYHTEVVKKHLFKPDEAKTTVTKRTAAQKEVVANGSDEMAYRFVYLAQDSGNEREYAYKDYSNRGGQYLAVDTIIPESTAKQVAEKLKEDPTFARRLAEYLFKQSRRSDKTADEWDALWVKGERKDMDGKDVQKKIPLRPPYEEWANVRGGESKMFVRCDVPGVYEPPKDPKNSVVRIPLKKKIN